MEITTACSTPDYIGAAPLWHTVAASSEHAITAYYYYYRLLLLLLPLIITAYYYASTKNWDVHMHWGVGPPYRLFHEAGLTVEDSQKLAYCNIQPTPSLSANRLCSVRMHDTHQNA